MNHITAVLTQNKFLRCPLIKCKVPIEGQCATELVIETGCCNDIVMNPLGFPGICHDISIPSSTNKVTGTSSAIRVLHDHITVPVSQGLCNTLRCEPRTIGLPVSI